MSAAMIIRISKIISSTRSSKKYCHAQKHFIRCNSTQSNSKVLECLENKSLLCVRGKESSDFLQGLITNDMKHFKDGSANIYCLFLNLKGRVKYDTIIYKAEEDDTYYIECDLQVVEPLQKHLKMYRVRRKIDIEQLDDRIKIWTMFAPNQFSQSKATLDETGKPQLEGLIFPCGTLDHKNSKFVENIMIYEDPRLSDLGIRILANSNISRNEIIKHLDPNVSDSESSDNYKIFRYKIGVGEGTDNLPPEKPLPLEVNCDYLHGISFHKGCYIGQELTARTYHTGVVRKRLMPLIFDQEPDELLTYDEKILDESGNIVGKFRGNEKKYGLGLMRITEALKAKQLRILGLNVKVTKPMWWPQESQTQAASADSRK